jgi:hypothetical protein
MLFITVGNQCASNRCGIARNFYSLLGIFAILEMQRNSSRSIAEIMSVLVRGVCSSRRVKLFAALVAGLASKTTGAL